MLVGFALESSFSSKRFPSSVMTWVRIVFAGLLKCGANVSIALDSIGGVGSLAGGMLPSGRFLRLTVNL